MKVTLIDDNEIILILYGEALRKNGYTVEVFDDPTLAVSHIKENGSDIVITDYHMPYLNGLEVKAEIQSLNPKIPVILLTGRQEVLSGISTSIGYETKIDEKKFYCNTFGFDDYVSKAWPDAISEIIIAVNRIQTKNNGVVI